MSDIDLGNLRRLLDVNNGWHPLPWVVVADGGPPDGVEFWPRVEDDNETTVVQEGNCLATTELICAAANALPALLADHARLTAEVARLRGLVERACDLAGVPAGAVAGRAAAIRREAAGE